MADLDQLETALRNADSAGDTEAATMIAQEIRRQQSATAASAAQTERLKQDNPAEYDPQSQAYQLRYGAKPGAWADVAMIPSRLADVAANGSHSLNPLRWALGAGENALSIGSGMIAAPINETIRGAVGAFSKNPNADLTAPQIPTYQPRTAEGKTIQGALGAVTAPVNDAIDWMAQTDNPNEKVRATGHLLKAALYAAPLVGKFAKQPETPAPSLDELKAQANQGYAAMRATGEIAPQEAFAPVIKDVESTLAENGYRPNLHPATADALQQLYQEGTRPDVIGQSPTGLQSIRRGLTSAENAAYNARNWDDYRLASKITDRFDQMVQDAAPKTGDALEQSNSIWSRVKKTQTIEQLLDRAENAANGQNQAGYENALRIQFRQLADSKRFAQFSPDEQAAIKQVAQGSGVLQSAMRNLGRGAIRGPVTGGIGALVAGHFGSPAAVAGLLLAELARKGATGMRENAAMAARDLVARGGASPLQYEYPPIDRALAVAPNALAGTRQPDLRYDENGRPLNALAR